MELRFAEVADPTSAVSPRHVATTGIRVCGLDEIATNESARIVGLSDEAHPRFEALGFCPGTTVRLDRKAPLGDPLIFELRGMRLALRRRDARAIRIEISS